MAGGISPVLSESFEDVLNAVQETARGRWFLEEYTKRKKTEDTAAILAAILKLENAMARTPDTGDAQQRAVLERAKQAIASARSQIKSLSSPAIPLSEEAQVFSKLAELSRKAFSTETEGPLRETIGKSVEVALRLVSELDTSFGAAEAPAVQPADTAQSQKYFQQDADIFEGSLKKQPVVETGKAVPHSAVPAEAPPAVTPPVAKQTEVIKEPPVIKTTPPQSARIPESEQPPKGARLTIHRPALRTENELADTAAPAMEAETPAAKPAEPDQKPIVESAPVAEKPAEQRIVIIRRKPGEQIEVPLVDSAAKSSAA